MIDLLRKVYSFWRVHGTSALLNRAQQRLRRNAEPAETSHFFAPKSPQTTAQLCDARFAALSPLPIYALPENPSRRPRVSVVTDSISQGSLFGGVGTAIIFSALLANRLGADLRMITRTERAKPESLGHLLSVYGIALQGETEYKFVPPYDKNIEIEISPFDIFVTTSWWTTAATIASIPAKQILYLLQEDERMFYPYGDDRLRCEAILKNTNIRYLINSKLLFDHLVSDGLGNIQTHGAWFEPAFPQTVFHPRTVVHKPKKKFIFYARPNNFRNLFYLGIQVIEAAITQKLLDPEKWEIILVGKDIPQIVFGNDVLPARHENMDWSEYAALAGTIDLGLSLMSTPHPSYPPLDLVASGAVVVTNSFGNKKDLRCYSKNLICASADLESLLAAIRDGVELASNAAVREENFKSQTLCRSWEQSFEAAITQLGVS